jgi:hypothetical protein
VYYDINHSMFSRPERNADGSFVVRLTPPLPVGVRLEVSSDTIVPDLSSQPAFLGLQRRVLVELTRTSGLFGKPPSLATLEAITPQWGFVVVNGVASVSPYTTFDLSSLSGPTPCFADLSLASVRISRSTIQPRFQAIFLNAKEDVIDLEWDSPPEEMEEVSDIGANAEGAVTLIDPATLLRQKKTAKEAVREAFRKADLLRKEAVAKADQFYEVYDLSDSESAFTEWAGSEEEESAEEDS